MKKVFISLLMAILLLQLALPVASTGKLSTSVLGATDADTGGMQYANWYFGQNNLKEVNVIIEINNDPATEDGLYFQAYDGYINGQMFYFGLQTRVGKPGSGLMGKGLIFSEFGTTDASNIRIASNGWYEVGTYEGPFISTRMGYNWTNHKYALTIKYKESDTIGDWYEFWMEDLTTSTNTYAGALRFPFPKDLSKKGITDYGGSWTELYYRAVQGSSLPQWSISILEVSAISKDGNLLFPKTAHLKNADNFYHIDQAFHPENNCLDFIIGGNATKSFNEKNITLSSGTIKVNATLDGDPWNGTLNFTLKREKPYGYAAAIPLNLSGHPVGTYTIQYISSGPKNATLLSIVPSPTQLLTSQNTITFTMNFTMQAINPSSPSSLTGTAKEGNISLSWTASTQGTYPIAGYAICRGTESGKEDLSKPIVTVDANTTTYTDKSVELNTTYFYVVKSFDSQNPPNYSKSSSEVSVWIGNPEDFAGLWINKDSETSGITKVNIRVDNGKFFIHVWGKCHPTDCDWGEESTNVPDADDGVLAVKWVFSFATEELKISISKNATLKIIDFTHFTDNSGRTDYTDLYYFARFTPSVPQSLKATAITNSINLTWTSSTQGTYPIAGYAIYRGTESGKEDFDTPIATVDANATTYTDKSIELNKTYYYVVKAFDNQNPANYSEPSNETSIEISDTTPPTVTINSPTNNSTVNTNTITISGTITDDLSGVDKATLNGNNLQLNPDGSFDTALNLTEGTNTITIIATDKAGNKTTKTITGTYENPIQTITITLRPDNPMMTVNGVSQEIDPGRGTKPVIIPKWGRTVVPIRAIVEALGGTIGWDGTARKVTINFSDTVINLWIDNPKAEVSGETKWIDENNHDVKPIIINSRTMLPLRFVAENLGCKVDWDAVTRTITITYMP